MLIRISDQQDEEKHFVCLLYRTSKYSVTAQRTSIVKLNGARAEHKHVCQEFSQSQRFQKDLYGKTLIQFSWVTHLAEDLEKRLSRVHHSFTTGRRFLREPTSFSGFKRTLWMYDFLDNEYALQKFVACKGNMQRRFPSYQL